MTASILDARILPAPEAVDCMLVLLSPLSVPRIPREPWTPPTPVPAWNSAVELLRGSGNAQIPWLAVGVASSCPTIEAAINRIRGLLPNMREPMRTQMAAVAEALAIAEEPYQTIRTKRAESAEAAVEAANGLWSVQGPKATEWIWSVLGVTCPPAFGLEVLLAKSGPLPGVRSWRRSRATAAAFIDTSVYRGLAAIERVLLCVAYAGQSESGPMSVPAIGARFAPERVRALREIALTMLSAEAVRRYFDMGHVDVGVGVGQYLSEPVFVRALREEWLPNLANSKDLASTWDRIGETVARRRRVAPKNTAEIDLGQAAADFYLLEYLAGVERVEEATQWLDELEEELYEYFVEFVSWAIGTEMGLVAREILPDEEPEVATLLTSIGANDFGVGWSNAVNELGTEALELARRAFSREDRPNGGRRWANVARIAAMDQEGLLPRRVFLDTCFSLQHNHGILFNRLHDVRKLEVVLELQGASDLRGLEGFASDRVQHLVRAHRAHPAGSESARTR